MTLTNPQYMPCKFLNKLVAHLGLKSDAALSDLIGIPAAVISNVRNRRRIIGPTLLLAAHEATGLPTLELRKWMVAA